MKNNYMIVTASGMSISDVKTDMAVKVLELCKSGWKLQGGASVQEEYYPNTEIHWFKIYQTMVRGKQKLRDYDIIEKDGFLDSLAKVAERMSEKLEELSADGWKLQGGAEVKESVAQGKSNCPIYTVYQTVIKEG